MPAAFPDTVSSLWKEVTTKGQAVMQAQMTGRCHGSSGTRSHPSMQKYRALPLDPDLGQSLFQILIHILIKVQAFHVLDNVRSVVQDRLML